MPGMDGITTAKEIVGARRAAVLILTAFSQRDLVEKAVRMSTAARRAPSISLAAAMPSIPGILMSRMARSGLSSLTRATASSPRPTAPTTS